MDKSWIVYGLYDPRDLASEVRYVGITTCGLNVRLAGHISYSKKLRTHRCYWIQSLLRVGIKPVGVILEEGTGRVNGILSEQKWVLHYTGSRLTNSTAGGEGLTGYKHSEETKAKLRASNTTPEAIARNRELHLGRKRSPEAIERSRQGTLGLKRSEETKANISRGKSTEEAKARARANNLGKVMSVESREKMRVSQTGKKRSPEAIEKVRKARIGSKMPEGALAKAWETRRAKQALKLLNESSNHGD